MPKHVCWILPDDVSSIIRRCPTVPSTWRGAIPVILSFGVVMFPSSGWFAGIPTIDYDNPQYIYIYIYIDR